MLVASGNEYANYYEKRGGKAGLVWRNEGPIKAGLFAFYQEDVSMETRKTFTLLGVEHDLPENPPIADGYRAGAVIAAAYDSREDKYLPENAWFLGCSFEAGRLSPHAAGAESFDYSAVTVETNRYTLFPAGFHWDIGARLSTAFDRVPLQLYQTLNGYGGIRGANRVPFDIDRGDRMVRVSTEIGVELPELPIVNWVYSTWHLVGFADAGLLSKADNPSSTFGFLDTSFSNWKKSTGLGVTGESFFPFFALYVAKEIDGDRTSPRVIVRIEKTF
jgi:outer membrane protein assembly factor BamA